MHDAHRLAQTLTSEPREGALKRSKPKIHFFHVKCKNARYLILLLDIYAFIKENAEAAAHPVTPVRTPTMMLNINK